jgi:hypothetical protein
MTMAYFAEKNASSQVLRVIVADDISWPQTRLGGTWVETKIADAAQQYAGPGLFDSVNIAPRRFIPPWVAPTHAENSYPGGAWVWHNGKAWRSLQAANVFEPGVASWREMLTEWPQWVQPVGSSDAYQIGEKITFSGSRYISLINANVWSPVGYPAGWAIQP